MVGVDFTVRHPSLFTDVPNCSDEIGGGNGMQSLILSQCVIEDSLLLIAQ